MSSAAVYEVYVEYYRDHPSHVILWFDGRVGRSTVQEVHRHTGRVSAEMREFALLRGLIAESVTVADIRLMAEAIDRIHEYAFRENRKGDEGILQGGLRPRAGLLRAARRLPRSGWRRRPAARSNLRGQSAF